MLRLAAAALALQVSGQQRPADPTDFAHRSPPEIKEQVEAALLRFNHRWQTFWQLSENSRHTRSVMAAESAPRRNSYLHCHLEQDAGFKGVAPVSMIRAAPDSFAVCPSWLLGDENWPDERTRVDAALQERFVDPIREERDVLIAVFEQAWRILPADDWLTGQLVRLNLDQERTERAADVADRCNATRWWCLVLGAYVTAHSGDSLAAESAFQAALRAMPDEERCRWNDVGALLDETGRAAYARVPCAQREPVHERFWWLADPLWSEPGNARFLDDMLRRTLVALRSAHGQDERYDWRREAGGDALATMVHRYGWPSLTFWIHESMDASHSGYLYDRRTALNANYTTFEYSPGRLAAVPPWRAVETPLEARHDDWQLSDPLARDSTAPRDSPWWPTEHFLPARPLVQLDGGQVAMLRRQDHVLMNTAIALGRVHRSMDHPTIDSAVLVVSPAPGAFTIHTLRRLHSTRTYVTQARIDTLAALASIEFNAADASAPPGGRARFSIAPPRTLAALAPGEIAISDPVVLTAPPGSAGLPSETDGALELMAPSTVVSDDRRLGVYWETYGIKPGDTVDVAVWIERYTQQGIARRLGIALNIAQDLNTPVVASWREPQPSRRVYSIAGPVPIIGRSLVLDVSELPPGDYWLDVAVATAGREAVRGRRSITIR